MGAGGGGGYIMKLKRGQRKYRKYQKCLRLFEMNMKDIE